MYNVESHGLSNKTTTAHNVKASLITDTSAKPDIIYIGRFLGSRTTELHTAIKLRCGRVIANNIAYAKFRENFLI